MLKFWIYLGFEILDLKKY